MARPRKYFTEEERRKANAERVRRAREKESNEKRDKENERKRLARTQQTKEQREQENERKRLSRAQQTKEQREDENERKRLARAQQSEEQRDLENKRKRLARAQQSKEQRDHENEGKVMVREQQRENAKENKLGSQVDGEDLRLSMDKVASKTSEDEDIVTEQSCGKMDVVALPLNNNIMEQPSNGGNPTCINVLPEVPVASSSKNDGYDDLASDDDNFSASTVSDGDNKNDSDADEINIRSPESEDHNSMDRLMPQLQGPNVLSTDGNHIQENLTEIGNNVHIGIETTPSALNSSDVLWKVNFPSGVNSKPYTVKSASLDELEDMMLRKLMALQDDLSSYSSMLLPGGWKCQACWQVLPDYRSYVTHITVCPISCGKCGSLFTSRFQLEIHIKFCKGAKVDNEQLCVSDIPENKCMQQDHVKSTNVTPCFCNEREMCSSCTSNRELVCNCVMCS